MDNQKTNYTALGMLFGIFIGSGIGVLLFVFTGQVLYIAASGLGAAIGMILGAGVERSKAGK